MQAAAPDAHAFFLALLLAVPAERLARFELTEEEREFKGAADDRKGLLEHRHAPGWVSHWAVPCSQLLPWELAVVALQSTIL